MAIEVHRDLVRSGQSAFAPGGAASIVVVTVDFGDLGSASKSFDVATTAVLGQKVLAAPSLDMPSGVMQDEIEMDPMTVAAAVIATNVVRLMVASTTGTMLRGQRNINLTIG